MVPVRPPSHELNSLFRLPEALACSNSRFVFCCFFSFSLRSHSRNPATAARRCRRPSVVEARRLLRGLSPQLHGQQQRRHRRPERHRVEDGLPEVARRRCHLDHAVLPLAAGRFRLRRFELCRHRSHVRHAERLRPHGGDAARRTASASCSTWSSTTPPTSTSGSSSRSRRRPTPIATGTSGATARVRISRPTTGPRLFGGSAWQWSAKTGQYYYHFFYPQQPDLNWRNPKVKDAMFDVTRFWYKRGVVGFRLDAVDTLFEDPNLTDNPVAAGQGCLRRAQPGAQVQHQSAGSDGCAGRPAHGRQSIQRSTDRRDLDRHHREAQELLRPAARTHPDAHGPRLHQTHAALGQRLSPAHRRPWSARASGRCGS